MEQERQKEEEQASGRQAHAKEIRKQVREKEEERVAARKAFFEEGVRLDHEAKERYSCYQLSTKWPQKLESIIMPIT